MSLVVLETTAIRVTVNYVEQRRGIFYFCRRLPQDLRQHYPNNQTQLFFSLQTRNKLEAVKRAEFEASKQNALWKALREGWLEVGPEVNAAAVAMLDAYGLKPGQWNA